MKIVESSNIGLCPIFLRFLRHSGLESVEMIVVMDIFRFVELVSDEESRL